MEDLISQTSKIIDELLAAERRSAPQPRIAPEAFEDSQALRPGRQGRSEAEVFDLLREIVAQTPRSSDPRFFNQLFAGRLPIATAGEMLASFMNVSMYTYKAAGPNVLLEWELVKRMLELAGIPDGDGTFLPGGSLANLVGMLLGRNQAAPGMRDEGAPPQRLITYVTVEGHYSINKNAGILGMGRSNVRAIAADPSGRLCPEDLRSAIETDLQAGHLPAVVVATSGTTVRGAFDPLEQMADICHEFGIWLHVDAAVGGSMLLHPVERTQMRGIERADSITWDAHKMMGVPLTCSALLVRDPEILTRSFSEAADYLFQADTDFLNPGKRSIQCGRRNDALKLWAAWQHLGDEGWAKRLDRQLHLARYLAKQVEAHPALELCEAPPLTMVNFVAPGKSSPRICEILHTRGDAIVGFGDCAGVESIRMVTMNPEVTEAQLDRLIEEIAAVASKLPDAAPSIQVQRERASSAASSS
jgi:sulfinoalanine decarboxylase/sulfinoalanine decarboxylase/aspartate 1-decarboxylase